MYNSSPQWFETRGTCQFLPLNHIHHQTTNVFVPNTALSEKESVTVAFSDGEMHNRDTHHIGFMFTVESSQISKKIFHL